MTAQPLTRQTERQSWVIYACAECDYYRCELASGVHMATNPKDPNGAMIRHPLTAIEVVKKGVA